MAMFQYDADGLMKELDNGGYVALDRRTAVRRSGGVLVFDAPWGASRQVSFDDAMKIVNAAQRRSQLEYYGGGQPRGPIEPPTCGWVDPADAEDAWASWENHLRQEVETEEDLLYKVEDQMMGY